MPLDAIATFLRGQVAGRNLHTSQLVYTLEDGRLEGVYSDRISFANVSRSEFGLAFDLFLVSDEKIYELNCAGERFSLCKDYSGVSVFRHEWAQRHSSGAVTGSFRLLTASVQKQSAQGVVSGVYDVRLHDGELHWTESQALYRDQQSAGDTHHPVAFDARCRLYFEREKLRFSYQGSCFAVDPVTLQRAQSTDAFPEFLSKER